MSKLSRLFSRFPRRSFFVLMLFGTLLVCARAALPGWIQDYVNRRLDRIPGYDGQIGDVDLHLYRGAYNIEDIKLVKTSGKVPIPFFESPSVDFSIQWRALLHGKIVGEIELEHPKLNFVNGPNKADSQTDIDNEWLQAVKDLFPFRINRFQINDGEVHYRDLHRSPKVDVALKKVSLVGTNFNNTRSSTKGADATIDVTALMEDHASFKSHSIITPTAHEPTFKTDLSLRTLKLTSLNDFLKAYLSVDAEGGEVSVDAELDCKINKFEGYVKPLIKDAQIFNLEKDAANPLEAVWEAVAGLLAELLENHRSGQIGTRVPLSGQFDDPKADRWVTFLEILNNAFIRALKPGLEDVVKSSSSKKD